VVTGELRVSWPDGYEHLKTCETEMYDESVKHKPWRVHTHHMYNMQHISEVLSIICEFEMYAIAFEWPKDT
jgi:hypothetical protein